MQVEITCLGCLFILFLGNIYFHVLLFHCELFFAHWYCPFFLLNRLEARVVPVKADDDKRPPRHESSLFWLGLMKIQAC